MREGEVEVADLEEADAVGLDGRGRVLVVRVRRERQRRLPQHLDAELGVGGLEAGDAERARERGRLVP
jgi:hypothetical protein